MAEPVKELTFEIPIDGQSETAKLAEALKHVDVVKFLDFRSDGFLLLCRASRKESELFRRMLSKDTSGHFVINVVNKQKSGSEILMVSGRWMTESSREFGQHRAKELDFFRAMEKAPIYNLKGPDLRGGKICFTVVAREKMITTLLTGLDELGISYGVLSLGRPKAKVKSALDTLTSKQVAILRLAHAMGYYDVPRRTNTEDLARFLGVDKGTVGEHLRRGEKRIFDQILS